MSVQYKLNKELAQMLKGGVIMDVTTPSRRRLPKQQAHVQLWRWSAFRLTSVQQAAFLA